MTTFAQRLRLALERKGISQAEAARQAHISQQSINYIINNNLKSSKLAPKIASVLNINPEWLIYGTGKFQETKIYELPLIHSLYLLNKFLKQSVDEEQMEYIVTDKYLGDSSFAYLLTPKKLAICCGDGSIASREYLTIANDTICITCDKQQQSFAIFEWRIRHVDF